MPVFTKEQIAETLKGRRRTEIPLSRFPDYTRAAVLIPIFPKDNALHLLLTARTEEVEAHKGQISFPGGTQDESDRDAIHTALREAEEELALKPRDIEIIGTLDDIPVPSKFIITPVVGYLRSQPAYAPHAKEVADVLVIPVSFFGDPLNATTEERRFEGKNVTVWHFRFGKYDVWGATAAMIRNLIGVLSGS